MTKTETVDFLAILNDTKKNSETELVKLSGRIEMLNVFIDYFTTNNLKVTKEVEVEESASEQKPSK